MLRRIILCMLMLTSIQMMTMPIAVAYETVNTPKENADGTLTVVERHPTTDAIPELPETITHKDQTYALARTATETDPEFKPPARTYSHTLYRTIPPEGINTLAAYFPHSVAIDEGEFKGEIGINPTNPYTIVEGYEILRVQVDKSSTITGLPDNDVSRIPLYADFEVSSGAYRGATQMATLQLLDVTYEVVGTDSLGLPNNYTAHLIYRGQEDVYRLNHYEVTAYYLGDITSSVEQFRTLAFYRPVEPEIAPVSEPDAEPEAKLPIFTIAVVSAVAVVFFAAPLFYFFLLSNAQLVRKGCTQSADEQKTESKTKEKRTTLSRKRLKLKGETARFNIPQHIDIMDGNTYQLNIKAPLANKEGQVELIWRSMIVAVTPLEKKTDINFKEHLFGRVDAKLQDESPEADSLQAKPV